MQDPVVELQSGLVRGIVEKHEDGFNYYAFKGVPYAEPPIGELRFKDPIPMKKWTGIRDCKNYGSSGVQYDLFADKNCYDEDCLNLNIFTHAINKPNLNNPVLVWTHGGDFNFGSADWYGGPDYLIRKKIVLITLNYRVGVLGFLNLEDDVAPGNQGFKDQLFALKWVQNNIRIFGGDPNNVTVGGISAGAVSAHYLALSPSAKDLFHKLICMGSCLYSSWAYVKNPKSHAIALCSFLGKKLENSREIVDFLRTIDTKQLLEAQRSVHKTVPALSFGPAVEPFMPVGPVASGLGVHIPCLIGSAGRPGLLMLYEALSFKGTQRSDFLNTCDKDFEKIFIFNTDDVLTRYNLNVMQARRMYFKNKAVSEATLENYVDFTSDFNFLEGIHRFVKVQAQQSSASTYLYRFDFESPNTLKSQLLKSGQRGAAHLDELPYIFKFGGPFKDLLKPLKKGTHDYKMMEQMTEMIANFVTYGRPTVGVSDTIPVHWKPIAGDTVLRCMSVDEDLMMKSTVNVEQKFLSAAGIRG